MQRIKSKIFQRRNRIQQNKYKIDVRTVTFAQSTTYNRQNKMHIYIYLFVEKPVREFQYGFKLLLLCVDGEKLAF